MNNISLITLYLFSLLASFYPGIALAAPAITPGSVYYIQSDDELKNLLQQEMVVVYFFADWCGPCKQMKSVYDTMAQEFSNILFIKVDVMKHYKASDEMNVMALPTIILFKNGIRRATHTGYLSKSRFKEFLSNF